MTVRTILFPVFLLLCNPLPTLCSAEIPGDANQDSTVDAQDYGVFTHCLTGPLISFPVDCTNLDLDQDGDIDLEDFSTFSSHFGMIDCSHTNATASSMESTIYGPDNVHDGNFVTRWSSVFSDDEWIVIDYGVQRYFMGLLIHWEDAYAQQYSIDVSYDGTDWSNVYLNLYSDGGTDVITFSPQLARYLRINCITRATPWGNSIYEVELMSQDRCYFPPDPLDELTGEERIAYIVGEMTLEEKTSFLYGATIMELRPIPRLRVPGFTMADGPLGCRHAEGTLFPAPIAMAASWDTDLVNRFGVAIGREYRNQNRQVWLGPGMNIIRIPQNGRNFEYYSEDPYLTSRMAVAAISGAQSQGVVACAKHYVANNQEADRMTVNVIADERTLREIYLPAFEASVKEAGVMSVMAAYNRLNGPYCTASQWLLTTILKDEWGFEGFVVSDWGAVHETAATANAGTDLEMDGSNPPGVFWGEGQLQAAVQNGEISEDRINEMASRVLRAMTFTGILDEPWPYVNEELIEHRPLVREIASSGMVLLKNENNLLPLDKHATQTIAVLGPNATVARRGGGGSSYVNNAHYAITPYEGLQNVAGPDTTFVLSEFTEISNDGAGIAVDPSYLTPAEGSGNGLKGEYYNNSDLNGSPAMVRIDAHMEHRWGSGSPGGNINNDDFSVRWTGTLTVPATGDWLLGMATDDGFRLFLDDELIADDWSGHAVRLTSNMIHMEAGRPYSIRAEYYEGYGEATAVLVCVPVSDIIGNAVLVASIADKVLLFVGLNESVESEGFDRQSFELDSIQEILINAVAAANPNTAVVIIGGSQVGMESWLDKTPSVLQAWYGGQEAGNAFADVIFGDVNPSGKLPMTFVRSWNEHPVNSLYPSGHYQDGLFVGYRFFDQAGIAPLFPFGFGLSYTEFTYSNLSIDTSQASTNGTVQVCFDIRNTGSRSGAESAQVYVRDIEASVSRPIKELKGFAKVKLSPGQMQRVTIELDARAFAYWDVNNDRWSAEPGEFQILVGASSRDIRLSETIVYP